VDIVNGVLAASQVPEYRWWLYLALMLTVGLTAGWGFAALALLGLLVFVARPFDFMVGFLVLVASACFVTMSGGGLTLQLGLLSIGILLMLALYALSNSDRLFGLPRTSLTWPLLAYGALSTVNAARGILTGASPRYVGLEYIAVLQLGTALLVANAFRPERDLRVVVPGLIAVAFGPTVRGLVVASTQIHAQATYVLAVPGIVAVLLFNLALRCRTLIRALGLIVLSIPLFLSQLVTFGRGLWTGCLAAILLSILVFSGAGRGASSRWIRSGLVVLVLIGLIGVGGSVTAIALGHGDLLQQAGARFASITTTGESYEARSTLVRLWEYAIVANHIRKNPWLGYGFGYSFPIHQPWSTKTVSQWIVHENFLFVWLKQGLIGLAVFLWMLWTAIGLGIREARRRTDSWESAWCATMAGATVFLVVFSLSNFPFNEISGVFLVALLWGVTMALTRHDVVELRWSALPSPARRPS
jgi:O-antigen ligase